MSRRWVGLVVAAVLIGTGCGGGDDDGGGDTVTTEDGSHDLTFAISDDVSGDELDQMVEIIENRLDALGVEDARVTVDGDELYIDVEGVDFDADEIDDVIGATAELRFRPVFATVPPEANLAVTPPEDDAPEDPVTLEGLEGDEMLYELGPSQVTGEIVENAAAVLNPDTNEWSVSLELTLEGIEQFNEVAGQCSPPSETCPTGQLAIVLDSVVLSAPTIQTPSFERDEIQISGDFTEEEAKDLALALDYGSLPVRLTLIP